MTKTRPAVQLSIAAANDCYFVGSLRFTSFQDLVDWLADQLPELD